MVTALRGADVEVMNGILCFSGVLRSFLVDIFSSCFGHLFKISSGRQGVYIRSFLSYEVLPFPALFSRSFVFDPFFAPGCGLRFATRHRCVSPAFPCPIPITPSAN